MDISDLSSVYDTSFHPEVISGKITREQALKQLLDAFEVNSRADKLTKGDGLVSLSEFEEYYSALSASIDDDDYFELMIRNAWHISGGANEMCSNTTNRRVLVTNADGTQSVREVENDIGISAKNTEAIFRKLNNNTNGPAIATMNLNGREGTSNQIANPYYTTSSQQRSTTSINQQQQQLRTQTTTSLANNGKPLSLTEILSAQMLANKTTASRR